MPFLKRWRLAILWMAVIYTFSASSDPFQVVPQNITIPDGIIGRIAHVFEFAILAILVGRAIMDGNEISWSSLTRIF